MPVQRVSKSFKDISASFKVNPITDDLIALKDENAIARSVMNLVFTNKGERMFQNDIGSQVQSILFENLNDITADSVKDEIENVIQNYEPRVNLIDVEVLNSEKFNDLAFKADRHELNVKITYEIVGINAQPQQLSFALEPTR